MDSSFSQKNVSNPSKNGDVWPFCLRELGSVAPFWTILASLEIKCVLGHFLHFSSHFEGQSFYYPWSPVKKYFFLPTSSAKDQHGHDIYFCLSTFWPGRPLGSMHVQIFVVGGTRHCHERVEGVWEPRILRITKAVLCEERLNLPCFRRILGTRLKLSDVVCHQPPLDRVGPVSPSSPTSKRGENSASFWAKTGDVG